jgi:hypothetical protein
MKQPVPESATESLRANRAPAGAGASVRRATAFSNVTDKPLERADAVPDAAAIAQREFPAAMQDEHPPMGVWVLLDANGRTLRKGTLSAGQSLGAVLTRLHQELPGQRLQPFESRAVQTAQGATLLVGIARAQ